MQTAQPTHNFYAPRHDIYAPHFADASDAALGARLNYLTNDLAEAERRARLFRTPREEREMRLMRRPLTTPQAFARFGLLLGTLPPAAIFIRLIFSWNSLGMLAWIFAPMLFICAALGRLMAKKFGDGFNERERGSWCEMMIDALEEAFIWAAATGAAGGFLFFGVGAIFGFACALPVALPAFSVFVPLHRLLARGGMIDARQLQPLAWGINLTIASLILSPHVIPY